MRTRRTLILGHECDWIMAVDEDQSGEVRSHLLGTWYQKYKKKRKKKQENRSQIMTHTLNDDTVFLAIQKSNKGWDLFRKARRKCEIQSSLLQSLQKGTTGRRDFIFPSDAEMAPCLRGNVALCYNGRLLRVQGLHNTLENREGHAFLSVTRWGDPLEMLLQN